MVLSRPVPSGACMAGVGALRPGRPLRLGCIRRPEDRYVQDPAPVPAAPRLPEMDPSGVPAQAPPVAVRPGQVGRWSACIRAFPPSVELRRLVGVRLLQ